MMIEDHSLEDKDSGSLGTVRIHAKNFRQVSSPGGNGVP
jgi:hypothetical protein